MKKASLFGMALITVLFVAACSPDNAATQAAAAAPTLAIQNAQAPASTAAIESNAFPTTPASSQLDIAKTDTQGMVTVEVTPENLGNPGDALVFDVAMNTHSVNLGMDLAKQAILMTDANQPIPAASWDGPASGGHHVNGKLSFPATYDGKPVLRGATRVTVIIKDVDVPTRLFTWHFTK